MLTWKEIDDEYHYIKKCVAMRGPIEVGSVETHYYMNPPYFFVKKELVYDEPRKCSSVEEGKYILEKFFTEIISAANLVLREKFRNDYKKDVHTEHCCEQHRRCKYAQENNGCTVCDGSKPASSPCNCEWM